MGIDEPGEHHLSASIKDVARSTVELLPERDDATSGDPHIDAKSALAGDDNVPASNY
jgi:hypothetical protein